MKRLIPVLLLAACGPSLRPEQEADLEFRQASQASDHRRAVEHMDRALAKFERVDYFVFRARLHQSLKQTDAAIADWTSAIRMRKTDAVLWFSRGLLTGADADFSEAIRLIPEYTEALLYRARLRQGADAQRDIAEARRIGAVHADGYYNEGVRALSAGDSAEAEKMFGFAIDLKPGHGLAHIAMARLFMERRQFAEAAAELDKAIDVQPPEAMLHYHRGNARLAAGRGEEALSDYAKAIELDPAEAIYVAARGLALHRVRADVERARANYDEALRMDKNCHAALYNRGLLNHELKLLEAAEKDLRLALTIRASPEGCLALGRVLHDRGEKEKALALLKGALEMYKDPEIRKTLQNEIERIQK
jgi:tetratricopeptide (TPR) repeat protein